MEKLRGNNIILVGYMGSGKSTVGALLAKQLNSSFYDTDLLIEQREDETISQIFALKGEEYFRNLETDLLTELQSSITASVLSTGGGMPLREKNQELLTRLGFVVFLKTSVQTAIRRLRYDQKRPLLKGENLEDRICSMLELRNPIYEAVADIGIETDHLKAIEITERIMEEYNTWLVR